MQCLRSELTVVLITVLSQKLEIPPRYSRTRDPSTRVVKGTARVFFLLLLNSPTLFLSFSTNDNLDVLYVLLLLLLLRHVYCCCFV